MRRSPDRRVVVLGIGLVALLAGGALLNALPDNDDRPSFGARPSAYRVLYRVEQRIDEPVVTWEERLVQRPFRGRSATFRRRPTSVDESPRGANITSALALHVLQDDGELHEVAGRVPGLGAGDQVLAEVIEAAVERGLAQRLGRRTVLDRTCTTYRIAEPPSGPLQRFADPADHDDVCIDEAGLVLHEEWTLDGRVVLVRTAVELDLNPSPVALRSALTTDAALPMPATLAAPRVEQLDAAVVGRETFVPAPPVPSGFRREMVVRHRVPLRAIDPNALDAAAIAYEGVAWVFTSGPDIMTVEAVTGPVGMPPWPDDPSVRTDLGALGIADSVLGPDGSEFRIDTGDGRWIRVRGTLSPRRVAEYATTLRPPEG